MKSTDQSKLAPLQMQTIHSSIDLHITGTDFFFNFNWILLPLQLHVICPHLSIVISSIILLLLRSSKSISLLALVMVWFFIISDVVPIEFSFHYDNLSKYSSGTLYSEVKVGQV